MKSKFCILNSGVKLTYKLERNLATTVLVAGLCILLYSFFFLIKPEKQQLKPLTKVFLKDLQNLKQQGALPEAWDLIHKVLYVGDENFIAQQFNTDAVKFEHTNGAVTLELNFLPIPTENEKSPGKVIIQMSLFMESNKIWELGRTYGL